MSDFVLHDEGEPRGEPYDEPREDDLRLDPQAGCWRKETGERVCAAHTTKGGEHCRCRKTKTMGNGRCRHHGGKTPTGKDAGSYKHGRYSKALPDRLAERYEEVRADEDLTTLREEIALIDSRIFEVLEALDAKDSARLWGDIETEFTKMRTAWAAEDMDEAGARLRQLSKLIEEGATQRSKWEEVVGLVDRKRKLVESKRRREKALQAYVPLERFQILLSAIDDIIRRNVDDDTVMRDIAREIKQTVNLG
jgi:hypothetical protein